MAGRVGDALRPPVVPGHAAAGAHSLGSLSSAPAQPHIEALPLRRPRGRAGSRPQRQLHASPHGKTPVGRKIPMPPSNDANELVTIGRRPPGGVTGPL